MTGHTIYLIDQGLIHQTRMALSPVGTQADVDLVASIYEEPWWLEMLGDQNLEAIWHKVWFPHNYKVIMCAACRCRLLLPCTAAHRYSYAGHRVRGLC